MYSKEREKGEGRHDTTIYANQDEVYKKKRKKRGNPFFSLETLIMHTRVCLNDVILDAHSHLCVTPRTNILIPNSNSLRQSAGYATKRILSKKKATASYTINSVFFFLFFAMERRGKMAHSGSIRDSIDIKTIVYVQQGQGRSENGFFQKKYKNNRFLIWKNF